MSLVCEARGPQSLDGKRSRSAALVDGALKGRRELC